MFPSHQLSFWASNIASERASAATTNVRIHVASYDLDFKWPEDKSKVERIQAMLGAAFAIGREDKARDFRKVLGIE